MLLTNYQPHRNNFQAIPFQYCFKVMAKLKTRTVFSKSELEQKRRVTKLPCSASQGSRSLFGKSHITETTLGSESVPFPSGKVTSEFVLERPGCRLKAHPLVSAGTQASKPGRPPQQWEREHSLYEEGEGQGHANNDQWQGGSLHLFIQLFIKQKELRSNTRKTVNNR